MGENSEILSESRLTRSMAWIPARLVLAIFGFLAIANGEMNFKVESEFYVK